MQPHAQVSTKDTWQPRGLLEGAEARLGEAAEFLTTDQREALTVWWLTVSRRRDACRDAGGARREPCLLGRSACQIRSGVRRACPLPADPSHQ